MSLRFRVIPVVLESGLETSSLHDQPNCYTDIRYQLDIWISCSKHGYRGFELSTGEKRMLEDKGALIINYIGENAWLCRYDRGDLQTLRSLPFVATVTL